MVKRTTSYSQRGKGNQQKINSQMERPPIRSVGKSKDIYPHGGTEGRGRGRVLTIRYFASRKGAAELSEPAIAPRES